MGEVFEDFEENKLRVSILYLYPFSRYIGSDTVACTRTVCMRRRRAQWSSGEVIIIAVIFSQIYTSQNKSDKTKEVRHQLMLPLHIIITILL